MNAHLAQNPANKVAVIAAQISKVVFLFPLPEHGIASSKRARTDGPAEKSNATMYRPFKVVDDAVVSGLDELLLGMKPEEISAFSDTSLISGALSLALAYINRVVSTHAPTNEADTTNMAGPAATTTANAAGQGGGNLRARILVVNVCSDLASQYVAIMNCIFAAQKMHVPVDVCRIGEQDTVFLQQASDTTGGVYMRLDHPRGIVQYLMTAFLPDPSIRKHLVLPTQEGVDFRPACFCHKRIVDIGYVCNVCLSSKYLAHLFKFHLCTMF